MAFSGLQLPSLSRINAIYLLPVRQRSLTHGIRTAKYYSTPQVMIIIMLAIRQCVRSMKELQH